MEERTMKHKDRVMNCTITQAEVVLATPVAAKMLDALSDEGGALVQVVAMAMTLSEFVGHQPDPLRSLDEIHRLCNEFLLEHLKGMGKA
jgi:hypothetical protein